MRLTKIELRAKIVERDGPLCWLCGLEIDEASLTIEHLLSKHFNGPNSLPNLVLAHRKCNNRLSHLSVAEKVRMRDEVRGIQQTTGRAEGHRQGQEEPLGQRRQVDDIAGAVRGRGP